MNSKFELLGVVCLAGLLACPAYAGVTINGTTITFSDNSMQSTAKPSDHGGTGNTVNGSDSFIGGGYNNLVTDRWGTIAGGRENQAGDNLGTTIDKQGATVSGGFFNTASGRRTTVGGGSSNTASGHVATIGGGNDNIANGRYAAVAGGYNNTAGPGDYDTVSGGYSNTASGNYATVAGGGFNTASGTYATVAGGESNTVSGNFSFVAGRLTDDLGYANSFVWGGASGTGGYPNNTRTSAGANTFNVWSAGGIYLNGIVRHLSDRNMKEAYSFVSAREVLDKVVEMPVKSWRFKGEDESVRHIGPVAQDFMTAFGYGKNDKYITATDADGVALAAIQGLNEKLNDELGKQTQVTTALQWQNAMLRNQNAALEVRLARLENAILKEQD